MTQGLDPGRVNILGIPVSVLNMTTAVDQVRRWIEARQSRYICVADVHSVMRARSDGDHRTAMLAADMVTPDGTPLVWFGRLNGAGELRRVCGPDLVLAVAAASVQPGWRHFLYGGNEGVAERLSDELRTRFPGIEVVGSNCPPFRALTPDEDAAIVATILELRADIVWVGLGCPKQEKWMLEHRDRLPGVLLVGIGAAFDFHTGDVQRAPKWMRDGGLEWLHRLASEPARLWRRYLILAPKFLALASWQILSNLPRRLHRA